MKITEIKALASMPSDALAPELVTMAMKTNSFYSSVWEITPAVAKTLLKANVKNRAIRRSRVEQYKADLTNGRWAQNGEAICFKKNGQLADGQHRLVAICETGVTVKMNVAVGCDDDGDHTYDSGLNRTNADSFKYNDIASYALVSSIVGKYFTLRRRSPFVGTREQKVANTNRKDARITRSALLEEYASSASLYQKAARTTGRFYDKSRVLRQSEVGGMIVYLVKDLGYDYRFVEEFFDGLATDGWNRNQTVAAVRVKLTRNEMAKNSAMSRQYKQALVIKAWNAYATGTNTQRVSYDEKKEGKVWFNGSKSNQFNTKLI